MTAATVHEVRARQALALLRQAERVLPEACHCLPCPGRGYDGHGMNHCAECCFGTGVEADLACPVHGEAGRVLPVVRAVSGAVRALRGQAVAR